MADDAKHLANSLSSVDLRLAMRNAIIAATVAASASAVVAWWLVPGLAGAAIVAGIAIAAAIAGSRSARDAASWLDARTGGEDLMISGHALVASRVRETELAPAVVRASAARATRRPSIIPIAIGGIVIAAAIATPTLRATETDADTRSTSETVAGSPVSSVPAAAVPGIVGAKPPRTAVRSSNDPGSAIVVPAASVDAVGGGRGTGQGSGASDQRIGYVLVPAATPSGTLETSAPAGGAAAELAHVATPYRALVGAYLAVREAAR